MPLTTTMSGRILLWPRMRRCRDQSNDSARSWRDRFSADFITNTVGHGDLQAGQVCKDEVFNKDNGVDHATHLDQLLPIPAVARKARDFTGAHGSDFAQADLGDHPFETRTLRPAGRRAAEIVVDHL